MKIRRGSWLFVGFFVALGSACSSAEPGTNTGTADGGTGSSCQTRCESLANRCGQPPSECASRCKTLTDAQLSCLDSAACEPRASEACLSTTPPSGGDASTGCAAFGASCTPGAGACCTDGSRPSVTCYSVIKPSTPAKNLCCVPLNGACTNVSECCSVEDFPATAKCAAGKCKNQ